VYSTFLGGNGDDAATAVTVDQVGDVYVAGWTSSPGFPVSPTAFQPARNGTGDAFVSKFPSGGTFRLQTILPNFGGNAGNLTATISGVGIHSGATAQLNCTGQTVVGTNPTVGTGGSFLTTTFVLTAALPGICDVVVTNPGSTSATLPQAFTVQQGGGPNIQISLSGVVARKAPPETAVAPNETAFFLTATNIGDIDAPNSLIVSSLSPQFSLISLEPPGLADIATLAAGGAASWTVPNLAAGQSVVFSYFGAFDPALPAFSPVTGGPVYGLPGGGIPPFPIPIPPPPATGPTTVSTFLECVAKELNNISIYDAAICAGAVAVCVEAENACSGPSFKSRDDCYLKAAECAGALAACAPLKACLPAAIIAIPAWIVPSDPNNLIGPSGVGGQRWISGASALTYGISFGNEATATAPAQQGNSSGGLSCFQERRNWLRLAI
jgi:hypothetical protein